MSLHRRRWSNDLRDSLMEFQKNENTTSSSVPIKLENNSISSDFINDSNIERNDTKSNDDLNLSMIEEYCFNKLTKDSNIPNSAHEILLNEQDNNSSSISVDFNKSFLQDDIVSTESSTLTSDKETVKFSSCNLSSSSSTIEIQEHQHNSIAVHICTETDRTQVITNKTVMENNIINSDFRNKELLSDYCTTNILKTDQNNHQFFSSPLEFSKTGKEMIAEIDEPDVWDALLALEEALSPVYQSEKDSEQFQNHSHLLNRLSQKFKETPTRFTEKLVSIIENSIISSESPLKHNGDDISEISLDRMTGEFRKLCKFIDDESMPEWAPSLINMTVHEKTESPVCNKIDKTNIETSKTLSHVKDVHNCLSQTHENFNTPKREKANQVKTPTKLFTPNMDKSFEYWETLCNIMCENEISSRKNANSILTPESSKENMEKMLYICDRQMASLDDSTLDIRNSEPCKKTDSELKLKAIYTPRSKSINKIFSEVYDKPIMPLSKINKNEKVNEKLILYHDLESQRETESSKMTKERISHTQFINNKVNSVRINKKDYSDDLNFLNKDASFHEDFKLLVHSPEQNIQDTIEENLCSSTEQDSSLLMELAKRRQRCLDTAKLMLEIDRDDPIMNEDSKCLETLYKLGIQDKTLSEVEDDTKFVKILNECLEYKNYLNDKSKPLLNIIRKIDSPNNKTKKTRVAKSKNQSNLSEVNAKNSKVSKFNKTQSRVSSLKSAESKKVTSREVPRIFSKAPPKTNKNILTNSVNLRASKVKPHSVKNLQKPCNQSPKKVTSKVIPKILPKLTLQEDLNSLQTIGSEKRENDLMTTPKKTPKIKLFVTPGKSSSGAQIGRKKPATYFTDVASKKFTPQKMDYSNIKSPLSLYIKGIDNDLIQNVQTRNNDRLLTPISQGEKGKSPKLKFKLASKENLSPSVHCKENIILPVVRYQTANKIHLINENISCSPRSITPNSKTKKLLAPVENTVVIRHQGRIIDCSSQSSRLHSETSVHIQHVAEKASTINKKFV